MSSTGTSRTIGSMVRGFKIGVTKWYRQRLDASRIRQRNYLITKEEKELLESYDRDEWGSVRNLKDENERSQAYAKATFRKNKWKNFRISGKDLEGLQKRAPEEGLPYQTFISSILHKYTAVDW